MGDFNINRLTVSGSEFHDNAAVIRNETHGAESDKDAEILRELQKVREQLETTNPMIAGTLADLQEAVEAKNKPTIKKLLARFSEESAKTVIASVASKTLLSWMGIS